MHSTDCSFRRSRLPLTAALVAAGALALPAPSANAADPEPVSKAKQGVGFVVVRETGVGSASAAQRYIDALMVSVAKAAGWPAAYGKFQGTRKLAIKYIDAEKPHFGFLAYGTYLALAESHGLTSLGRAKVRGGGGAQYFIVSKNHFNLDGCKGKSLASNHARDKTFVDRIVFGEGLALSDFEFTETRRPVQTLKAVINGDAECALVDDSQIMSLTSIEGGPELRAVWSSRELPPTIAVAFGNAEAGETKAFAAAIPKICAGEHKKVCEAAALEVLEPVSKDEYAADLALYRGK